MKNGLAPYRRFLGTGFLSLFCLLLYRQATAVLSDQEISITPQGIQIQITERALGEVLRHVQDASGIRFVFSRALGTTPITATIRAPDWPTAIRELLRPFNTAEVCEENELSRVYILKRGTEASVAEETSDTSAGEGQQPEDIAVSEPPPATSLPALPPPPPAAGGSTSDGKWR